MKTTSNNADIYQVSAFAKFFNRITTKITKVAGSPISSITALIIIIAWLLSGPFFGFSDTWQLVINTGTTIITFIMVFIIQQSQNKDTTAIQLKLNELLACEERASNRLVSVEDLTEEELIVLKKFYTHIASLSREGKDLYSSHSLDEAEKNYRNKSGHYRKKRNPKAEKPSGNQS